MEIVIDKRAYYVLVAVLGVIGLFAIYSIAMFLMGLIGSITGKNPGGSTNETVTLESICSQKSAMQMFIQNQKSTHPNVIKLKKDIEIYNQNHTFTGCG